MKQEDSDDNEEIEWEQSPSVSDSIVPKISQATAVRRANRRPRKRKRNRSLTTKRTKRMHRTYFQQMTCSFGIKPLSEHYSCMVDLLGRAGQLERACNLIHENASDEAIAWGSLLGACRVHGNVELCEIAARRLFEIDPNDSGNYVLLANTYASKDRWDDVEKVKKMMSENRMRKPPGCSWV